MTFVNRRFEAVLFDIDGTLIDSNAAHAEAWARALHDYDIPIDVGRIRPLIGKGGDKLLCEAVGIEEHSSIGRRTAQRKKEIFAKMLPGLRPTPGARDLLVHLRAQDVTLGTATSADDSELHQLLQQAGVDDLFHLRASKDDAGESKPDPDIVEAALARAKSRPELTVMIGDTPYDIEAADRAGIASIAVRCGGYWSDGDLKNAIAIFDDPAQLLNVLREG
jgi:HAD superfamily hydrolase (TIGR01509 family)